MSAKSRLSSSVLVVALVTVVLAAAGPLSANVGASSGRLSGADAASGGGSLAAGGVTPQPPYGADPFGIGNPFREHTGIVTQYVRDPEGYDGFSYPATTWQSITDQIESGWYADRGIQSMLIYGAWKSTPHFLGLPPLDFFDVQVGTGTLADFDAMAAAAKAHSMPLLMYIELIYIHPDNPTFVKAAQDRASDVESFERNLFRWDERPQPQASCPSNTGLPSANTWTRDPSIANNRCYVQAWGSAGGALPRGFPAFDFEKPEAMAYAKSVLGFWIDHGVDGFIYDAAHTYLGMNNPTGNATHLARQRELMIDFPRTHVRPDGTTTPGWFHDEGQFGDYTTMTSADLIGFTHVRVQGGDDFNSFASQAMRVPAEAGRTVDQLEDHWATYVDTRRQHGGGAVASLVYGNDESIPGPIRALDAAVQAGGAGIEYYFSYQHHLPDMSSESQELFWDVLRTINRSPALAPGASRERLPSQSGDDRHDAVLRRSMDGTTTALALFNYGDTEKCVSVNLGGSGVTVPQQTTNIATGQPGPWLRETISTVRLPAYGYLFLDVDAGPGFPWTVVDDAADGWTFGGGWNRITDPSAFGGSRIGGNTQGSFAEYTFTGRSVQGWGRKNTQGAQAVEVFVDGVSYGVHSQRRSAPISGGSTFYGQQLFSISGLSAGPHTLRIQQNSLSGTAGSGTSQHSNVDYLRVSDQVWTAPAKPAGGDRCADDATPPTIDIQSPVEAATQAVGAPGNYPLASTVLADYACADDLSGVASCEGSVPSGSPIDTSSVGFHEFTVTATDVAGHESTTTVRYNVVWPGYGGLRPPLAEGGAVTAKAGSTIPVKFRLGVEIDPAGVLAPGYPVSIPVACTGGGPIGPSAPTNSAAGLVWTGDVYQYDWKTDRAWGGTCRQLRLVLADNTVHVTTVRFK